MLGLAYWHFERELSFSSRKTPAKGRKSGVLKGAAREKKERENRQKRILSFDIITQRIDRRTAELDHATGAPRAPVSIAAPRLITPLPCRRCPSPFRPLRLAEGLVDR